VYCAGQLGFDPATGELLEGIEAQTERALANLGAVLEAAGASLADVVKTTCFLADINDFAAFNGAYQRMVPEPYPARSTFQVGKLPRGALVEIEAIAVRPG
jgi:2-iminobutanoate/2-iminopropanoate deaminase